jgi:hypothetical protein
VWFITGETVLDSYRELLDLIVRTPTQLRDAADVAQAPASGEWGAAQVLAHLATAERLWLGRLNQILQERDALLRPGRSAELRAYEEQLMSGSVADNLSAFNATRGETVSLLMGLSLRDWEKSAMHETRGEMTVADVVEAIVDHDAEHLHQLEALR